MVIYLVPVLLYPDKYKTDKTFYLIVHHGYRPKTLLL